jgi:hypothetical protein
MQKSPDFLEGGADELDGGTENTYVGPHASASDPFRYRGSSI